MSESHKGHRFTEEQKRKSSISHMGILHTAETKEKLRQINLNKSEEWRRKMSESQKGEKGHNWQGGKTSINKGIRKSVDYKLWKEAVFKRDDFTCQECHVRGGILHSHHIKPFSLFPELRFDISNGQTLCKKCHEQTETYGNKIKKKSNLIKL